jgi:hypothetical protein
MNERTKVPMYAPAQSALTVCIHIGPLAKSPAAISVIAWPATYRRCISLLVLVQLAIEAKTRVYNFLFAPLSKLVRSERSEPRPCLWMRPL